MKWLSRELHNGNSWVTRITQEWGKYVERSQGPEPPKLEKMEISPVTGPDSEAGEKVHQVNSHN